MSTRPASPPSVARWKFVLGAILFLAVAATVLLLGESPPGVGTMIVVVLCLGGSVALSVAPYLIEYEARLRLAEAQARDHIENQVRRLTQTSEQLTNAISRSQSTEEQAGQALGALEELTEKLTAQADELAQGLARANERELTALKADLVRAQHERDESFTTLDQRLDHLGAQLTDGQQTAGKTRAAQGKTLEELKERMIALAARVDLLTAASRTSPHSGDAHTSGPTAPGSSAAETKPVPAIVPTVAVVVEEEPAAREPVSPSLHVEIASATDGNGSGDASMHASTTAVASPAPVRTPHTPKPRVRRAPEAPAAVATSRIPVKPQPLELPLMGGSDVRPIVHRGSNSGTSTLVATAYIGIGNKLYVRGEGPGLSWDQGVPMQFLAIGKWGWTSPEAASLITCRIYRNDDTPMLDENITIAPGAKAEITPRF